MKVLKKSLLITLVLIWKLSFTRDIYVGHISGSASDISIIGTGTVFFSGNVSIAANGIYNNAGTVEVQGDIVNANTGLAFGTGTLSLTGTVSQSISGIPLKVYDIIFNNTSTGIVLGTNLILSNTATFTDGIVTTGSNNFIFNAGSSITGSSGASHVNGTVEKIGNTAFTFPIGDGTMLRTAAISAPVDVADVFTAKYFYTGSTSGTLGSGLNNVSSLEKWNIYRTVGSSTPNITLSYDPTYSVKGTVADLRVASLISTTWTDMGGSGSGNLVPATTASSNFGEFTFGSSTNLNSLSVELISFTAAYNVLKNGVDLNWATATEINSDYFTVERSINGKDWIDILVVKAAGNSSYILKYNSFDTEPFCGTVFYRLRQTDINDSYNYSSIQLVNNNSKVMDVAVFPNPMNNQTTLKYWSDIDDEYQLVITNTLGQVIFNKSIVLNHGQNLITIDLEQLIPGNYNLKIQSSNSAKFVTKNIIKIK